MGEPLPGRKVRGSRTGRPIMALLDLLGRRWTLRILWELREGTFTFRELQSCCDEMSPSVLNKRLAELRTAGIVALRREEGYGLTRQGVSLHKALAPLHHWAKRWTRHPHAPG